MKNELTHFLQSRIVSEERARLYRIGERLRNRLAHSLGNGVKSVVEPRIDTPKQSDATHFNRLLIMWLDLNCAIARARHAEKALGESNIVPWNCDDKQIGRLWEEITRPANFQILWEWLYQSASGEAEIWAQQALTECQLRSEKTKL